MDLNSMSVVIHVTICQLQKKLLLEENRKSSCNPFKWNRGNVSYNCNHIMSLPLKLQSPCELYIVKGEVSWVPTHLDL